METSDLLQILIPSLISLIGFPLTYFFTKRQIKSEHRMELALRTNEIKRELYQKQCSLIWIFLCGGAASPVWREPPIRTLRATACYLFCLFWI